MKIRNLTFLCFFLAACSLAQTPSPQFEVTERVAIEANLSAMQDAQKRKHQAEEDFQNDVQQLRAIESDIRRHHPGYELDEQTMRLTPLPAQPSPPAATRKDPQGPRIGKLTAPPDSHGTAKK